MRVGGLGVVAGGRIGRIIDDRMIFFSMVLPQIMLPDGMRSE
jgi:hypothetical protein